MAAATIRVPTERQGQTGLGQGGYACWALQQVAGRPVTTALRSPIPLETDLSVIVDAGCWLVVDPAAPETVILEARLWEPDSPTTSAVGVAAAEAARAAANVTADGHPAQHCISCGIGDRSLHVHAGPLPDGRWASPLRFPQWSLLDGAVDPSLVWMAIDCATGWYTARSGSTLGSGVTAQFAVDISTPLDPNDDHVIVAWNGDFIADWDGRKRGAAAAVFTSTGDCVASSRSFWVRPKGSR